MESRSLVLPTVHGISFDLVHTFLCLLIKRVRDTSDLLSERRWADGGYPNCGESLSLVKLPYWDQACRLLRKRLSPHVRSEKVGGVRT